MLERVAPPQQIKTAYFLLGRCVRALAAADFAAEDERGSRSTLDAAVAALAEVTSLFPFLIFTSFPDDVLICVLTGGLENSLCSCSQYEPEIDSGKPDERLRQKALVDTNAFFFVFVNSF